MSPESEICLDSELPVAFLNDFWACPSLGRDALGRVACYRAGKNAACPGHLYDASHDEADGQAFLERSEHDPHQFRFIVSAEDGARSTDLKPFVRELLMPQMERDLDTKLDWVAVDHFNTGHPHTHISCAAATISGQDLVMARDYIGHGVRARAQGLDHAGARSGDRNRAGRRSSSARSVQERFTLLDRYLMARARDEHAGDHDRRGGRSRAG